MAQTAVGGPLPLRLVCEAQLGFEYWWTGRTRNTGWGVGRQALSAERLLVMALVLAVTSLVSGINLQATGRALVFEHLPTGPAALLGERAVVIEGQGAAKGATPDRVPAPPVPPSLTSPDGRRGGPPEVAVVPALRGALPVGKGMWIWLAEHTEGSDPQAIVARAQATGLTHLYVRTASLRQGFYAADFLNRLLPVAHAARIRVYAWDFPYLKDVPADVNRALQAIHHTTPDGHRVDGYVADIELRSQGVNITPETARAFGEGLRRAVGPNYPLIACVPRPNPRIVQYPFADVVASFDAIAPMDYWMHRDPVQDITGTFRDLAGFSKPVIPIGQAYDARSEGGPAGVPPRDQLLRFMQAGEGLGAIGVSWWSWQHADQQAWDAIRDAEEFRLPPGPPETLRPGQIRSYQVLLSSLGFPAPHTAVWDPSTVAAVEAYQKAARLPVTGIVDEATHAVMFTPFPPPIQPLS
ncbi:MAG TPA: peptidoglycan-binding domain-containing protein [Acidimicrobiales bacterium]|nr:peptidoglycan-binding domain-containing protein [Acidimicrobiales bacterium]